MTTVKPGSVKPGRLTPTDAANTGAFAPADWLLFSAVALIWGSSFLLIAIGLDALPPSVVTLLRVGLGAAALLAWPTPPITIERSDWARVLLLSFVWVGVPFTLFPLAQQYINSALTGLLNGGTPIFVALFGVAMFGHRPRGAQLAGIIIGFIGVLFISLPSLTEGSSQTFGVLLVLAATVSYGIALNLAPPLQRRYGSVALMGRVLILGTLWVAPWGLWDLRNASWELGPVLAVAVLGIIGTGAAFAFMASLVGRVGSTRASFITYLIPVVALILGVLFRNDDVSPVALIGVALAIGGAVLASRAHR